jgi:hypothetical protein
MKLKYYLRGLGIGIVVTGIIMSIANSNKSDSLTDVQIIQKAQELGMVTKDDYETVKTDLDKAKTSIDDLQSKLDGEDKASNDQQNAKDSTTETPKEDQNVPETANDAVNPTTSDSNNVTTQETNIDGSVSESTKLKFSIVPGMGSEAIAKLLEQKGIIENASDFNSYIVNSGNENSLQTGEYEVSTSDDYDSIMKKITGK